MRAAAALILLALAACQGAALPPPVTPPGGPPRLPPTPDTCGTAAIAGFIGQTESVLAATTFAQPIRILRPGQPVTEDYSTGRLNIMLDRRGIITGAGCG